jgi:hypothetical protein
VTLDELRQMCDAPYEAYNAYTWCRAANELLAICEERRALGARTFELLKREAEESRARKYEVLAEVSALRSDLQRIAAIDPDEWHEGDGWRAVSFIQRIATDALREEGPR